MGGLYAITAAKETGVQYTNQVMFQNEDLIPVSGSHLENVLHKSIGALTFLSAKNKKRGMGSGVLISKDIILTAAHNIFNVDLKQDNINFKFYIGVDGVADEYYQIEGWEYPAGFKTCSQMKKMEFDYAIMKLKKPINFDKYLSLSLLCPTCLSKDKEKYLKIFGFPSYTLSDPPTFYKNNFTYIDIQCKKMKLFQYGLQLQDRIVMIDPLQFKIGYGISTLPGQSGCPVVVDNSIIAIHTGGDKGNKFNVGRIIDEGLIKNIYDWTLQINGGLFNLSEDQKCQHLTPTLLKLRKLTKFVLNQQYQKTKEIKEQIGLMVKKEEQPQDNQQISIKPSSTNPVKTNPKTKLSLPKQGLKSVDLSEYANLLQLYLGGNSLEAIDLSHCPLLQKLQLQKNQLRQVDTKANTKLTHLYLFCNKLSAMDVSSNINLTQLWLSQNQLSAMDVSSNINLTHLYLHQNQLSAMDVSRNINLTWLYLHSNQLSAMDVSSNINLTWLHLSSNQLSAMDVSKNINLTLLDLSSNQLSAINLSANSNLQCLCLNQNKIAEIDLSRNTKLRTLQIQENKLARISLVVAGNVPAYRYTNDFDLSDQLSAACLVELKCEETSRGKAAGIAGKWREKYSQQRNNKHACAYNYQVL